MTDLSYKIIQELQKHTNTNLPDIGIVAGQAVAEAYFRVMNIPIQTRIKDIDLFYPYSYKKNINMASMYGQEFLENYFKININIEEIKYSKDNSGNQMTYLEREELNILSSFEYDNINFIKIFYPEHLDYDLFLNRIVDQFDLNIVQIGICLKTKRLYLSENFKAFLENKQMEIVNFCRPISSLLRFFHKSQIFNGIYYNYDLMIQKTIVTLNLLEWKQKNKISNINKSIKIEKNKHNRQDIIQLFGKEKKKYLHFSNFSVLDKFNKLNQENRNLLEQYFKIDEIPFKSKKIFNFNSFHLNGEQINDPNFIIRNIIEKNNINPTKDNFKILNYSNIDIIDYFYENFNDFFIQFDRENFNFHFDHYPDYSNFNLIKNNRFYLSEKNYLINNNITPYLFVEDKLFNYYDFLLNNKLQKYEGKTSVIYYDDSIMVKFIPKILKNEHIFNNLKLFKSLFYSKIKEKNLLNQILTYNLIDKNLIDFILLNDLDSFLNLKIKSIKDPEERFFLLHKILTKKHSFYNEIKKHKNDDLKCCLRHEQLFFKIMHSKDEIISNLSIKYIAEKIRLLEKESLGMLGLIENGTVELSFFIKDISFINNEYEMLLKNSDLNSNVIIIPEEITNSLYQKKIHIKQVINKLSLIATGQRMRHCVGGSYPYLLDGSRFYFNVFYNKKEYTLELTFNPLNSKNNIFKLNQFKGKFNKSPDKIINQLINEWINSLNTYFFKNLFHTIDLNKYKKTNNQSEFNID